MPTFVGLGMARSGTRWMAQCLGEHPEVYVPPQEALFFARRRFLVTWRKGLDWYAKFVEPRDKPSAKAWGEISPIYLADDESPHLIRQHVPHAKLFCSLRDQAGWLYSAYRLFLHFNPQIYETDFSFRTYLVYSPQMFRELLYLEHIRRYQEIFPKDQLLVLLYDDLKAEPEIYIRKIYGFLGVDDTFLPPSVRMTINPMELTIKRSYSLARFAQRLQGRRVLGRLGKAIESANTVTVPRDALPERHQLTEDVRDEIRQIYADHNKALGEFLGRDLSHWNRPGATSVS
jgi:hypothetical protein